MLCHRALVLALAAAGSGAQAVPPAPLAADLAPLQTGLDYHSFANVEQFRVTHLQLDLRVDSEARVLRGVVGLSVTCVDPGATELILDTRELDILGIAERAQGVLGATSKSETTWASRPFHFERKDPILGEALVIELPPSNRPTRLLRIEYQTSPGSSGLQWVGVKQTAGRHQPYLFTQSEPIGARSWIPLQDSPQVRITYAATIHTSDEVLAVMSARHARKPKKNGEYVFVMPDPVPPHLITLAVGDLDFKETGPRTGVYAEKSAMKAAVEEFAAAGSLLEAAERLWGRYRWERFDLVVMPPAFPVAAVQGPGTAFVSPTAITGDQGGVRVIAHELAHAWAGDLVNNATWRDLWLNEAMARYLEMRLVDQFLGEPRGAMQRVMDLASLKLDLARLDPAAQVLALDLRGRDPNDGYTSIPYVKGALFMTYLETQIGRERFDAFIRGYFDHYSLNSVTTEQFVQYLETHLPNPMPGSVTHAAIAAWLGDPGLPTAAVLPISDAFVPVDATRAAWLADRMPAKKLAAHDWAGPQWIHFIDGLPASVTARQLAELDQTCGFAHSADAEIARAWFSVVIRQAYQPGYMRLEEYLGRVGRRALILPLYRDLMRTAGGAAQAQRVFAAARAGYHPATAAAIDAIVGLREAPEMLDE